MAETTEKQQAEKPPGVPLDLAAMKDRAAEVREKKLKAHPGASTRFDDLAIDLVAAIAHGASEPQEMAREFCRLGADFYDDPEMWITWDGSNA